MTKDHKAQGPLEHDPAPKVLPMVHVPPVWLGLMSKVSFPGLGVAGVPSP